MVCGEELVTERTDAIDGAGLAETIFKAGDILGFVMEEHLAETRVGGDVQIEDHCALHVGRADSGLVLQNKHKSLSRRTVQCTAEFATMSCVLTGRDRYLGNIELGSLYGEEISHPRQ